MRFRVRSGRTMAGLAGCCFLLGAAGCQSGDAGSVLGLGGKNDKPEEPKVLQSELLAYCPKVTLREGTAFLNRYVKGGEGDPAKLAYQASISDVTRSCSRSGGTLSITVAAAGKVVPGPAAGPGEVTLPIRIVASQAGTTVLYSNLSQHMVALGDASAAVQFVVNDPNVSMPDPQQADIIIYVGFDEGPAKAKPDATQ